MKTKAPYIIILIMIFLTNTAYGLTNHTQTHKDLSNSFIIQTHKTLYHLSLNQTRIHENSSTFQILCQEELKKLNLTGSATTSHDSGYIIQTQKELLKLCQNNITHKTLSARTIRHVNGTQTLNDSISRYIKELNSTANIILGQSSMDAYIYNKTGSGYHQRILQHQAVALKYPYESLIISLDMNEKHYIIIYAETTEAQISALRHLKEELQTYETTSLVRHYDQIKDLAIYDYIHLPENQPYYNTHTDEFEKIKNTSLHGLYNETVIDVMTPSGVLLREIRLNPLNSDKILNYLRQTTPNTRPIIFAGGLWSDIYAWKTLGAELCEEGQDVFLIEITGGPGQDCDSCPNYNYTDLTEEYWPALIATAQSITNTSQITYVGHSNGARTGLNSLMIYDQIGKKNASQYRTPQTNTWTNADLTTKPIKTYIAIGVPGAFDKETIVTSIIVNKGPKVNERIINLNYTHVAIEMLEDALVTANISNKPKNKIAFNLWQDYYHFIISNEDIQPGTNLSLEKFRIIAGTSFWTHDLIVTMDDEDKIFHAVNSSDKMYQEVNAIHTGMCDNKKIQELIKSYIKE